MVAFLGRVTATERPHGGSVRSFSSGCRFEPPVSPGSTRSTPSRPELARPVPSGCVLNPAPALRAPVQVR